MTASLMSAALETKQTSVSFVVISRVLECGADKTFSSEWVRSRAGALEVSQESLGSLRLKAASRVPSNVPQTV